jgi:hypothetical protein
MANLRQCIAKHATEHMNWTLSIRAANMEDMKLSLDSQDLNTLLHSILTQAIANSTIDAGLTQGNLTGEALKWYTTPWLNIDILFSSTARIYGSILGLVLFGTLIWTLHHWCEELISELQLKLQWRAVINRAGFLVAVYSTFLAMDEGDREQAMEWQWWASVIIGFALLVYWVVWFLGWAVVEGLRKLKVRTKARCRALVLFGEEVVPNGAIVKRSSPGAWVV